MLEQYIEYIDEPNRSRCLELYNKEFFRFSKAPGSSHNHQAYEGGYLSHIFDCMRMAIKLYDCLNLLGLEILDINTFSRLPFKLSDAMLVLFLHDLEKPWKRDFPELINKDKKREFRTNKCNEYGLTFTDKQLNALKYIEGEGADYSSEHRIMNELAAFCHICDVASSRIFYD